MCKVYLDYDFGDKVQFLEIYLFFKGWSKDVDLLRIKE